MDKYLQEAVERCERDVDYFNGWHMAINTSSQKQKADSVEYDEEKILELIDQDTGEKGKINAEHYIQYHDELETIPEEEGEDPQIAEKEGTDKIDMIAYSPEESDKEPFNLAIDNTSEDPTIVMGKPVTIAFVSDDVCIPTEKVGCLQVTSQLQEFLIIFHQSPKKKLLNRYTRYYKR